MTNSSVEVSLSSVTLDQVFAWAPANVTKRRRVWRIGDMRNAPRS